ncbi:hypothetical protein M8998_01590 [Sphingobacterium sp. lm-10]|uniref:hypothetical protein n=1 Tax=Sphingobacterium sp. lm-10 TaxID=2944904 RepID=UPI002021A7F7|nr:hypothetical protein [Sphingobacterium sp. lm-10]MCL7986623.1 hypothetical protein [Sphingobacterium sp. lm-10]
MKNLEDHHKKNFIEVNERLGLAPDEYMFKMSHGAFENDTVVFADDLSNGHIIGKSISVASIAELKRLSGVPNDGEDDHVVYPVKGMLGSSANEAAITKQNITEDMKNEMTKAASAYVLGDPEKVREYEDLINKLMFPGKALVFSAEDLYIKSGQTCVLGKSGDTELYNFGTITIEQGGQIQVVGNTQVTCQIFTQL